MQAIETIYHGPTNHRGARISAKAQVGKITIPYEYSLSVEANHDAAARAFAEKWGWAGAWYGGGRADGKGNVYVCVPSARHDPAFVIPAQE